MTARWGEPPTAYGLAGNHGFLDGDKRIVWIAARWFLADNGCRFRFDPMAAIRTMEGVAGGAMSEARPAAWFRDRLAKRQPGYLPKDVGPGSVIGASVRAGKHLSRSRRGPAPDHDERRRDPVLAPGPGRLETRRFIWTVPARGPCAPRRSGGDGVRDERRGGIETGAGAQAEDRP